MSYKGFIWSWLAKAGVGLYTAFVLQHLWNWFVTAAFGVSSISFAVVYGLLITIELLVESSSDNLTQQLQFKGLGVALDACVPAEKQELVRDQLEVQAAGIVVELGLDIFGRMVSNTAVLLLGAVVHLFV